MDRGVNLFTALILQCFTLSLAEENLVPVFISQMGRPLTSQLRKRKPKGVSLGILSRQSPRFSKKWFPTKLDPRVLRLFLSAVGHLDPPGETLGQWNESAPGFLAQNNRSLHGTANQNKHILFDFPRVSPGDQPMVKKPEGLEGSDEKRQL